MYETPENRTHGKRRPCVRHPDTLGLRRNERFRSLSADALSARIASLAGLNETVETDETNETVFFILRAIRRLDH